MIGTRFPVATPAEQRGQADFSADISAGLTAARPREERAAAIRECP